VTRWLAAAGVMAALALAGCQPAPQPPVFQATDITGAAFARDFRLTDHNGRVRTLADFKGKAVAVFFGYIHCPDVCPTTLSDFAAALQLLGQQAGQVQVIFCDGGSAARYPDLLKQFVPAFNPSFLGMVADADTLRRLAKEYKVVYQKNRGQSGGRLFDRPQCGTYVL